MVAFGAEITFNERVLNSTFRISGVGSTGTCFLIGKRVKNNSNDYFPVFVTAAHVLNEIKSDSATLFYRGKDSLNNYFQIPIIITIKNKGKALYFIHTSLDLAAFYIPNLKYDFNYLLIQGCLATDKSLVDNNITIGDELFCLGYPYNLVYNEAGFPILRSGKIASYPLIPSSKYNTFLFDFAVFPGNSGGPVYLISTNRMYADGVHAGEELHQIMGLLTEQIQLTNTTEDFAINKSLQLGKVISANLIKEFIMALPDPK